jgi:hypothetical protein
MNRVDSHERMQKPICRYFGTAGGCRFGTRCRNRHEPSSTTPSFGHSHTVLRADPPPPLLFPLRPSQPLRLDVCAGRRDEPARKRKGSDLDDDIGRRQDEDRKRRDPLDDDDSRRPTKVCVAKTGRSLTHVVPTLETNGQRRQQSDSTGPSLRFGTSPPPTNQKCRSACAWR